MFERHYYFNYSSLLSSYKIKQKYAVFVYYLFGANCNICIMSKKEEENYDLCKRVAACYLKVFNFNI